MASADPTDWIRARDEYLDPLDHRFPKHPFREETEVWRDRIDLRDATRRAEILEKPNLAAFSKPKTEAEALYQVSFTEADAALKLHHDGDAEAIWSQHGQATDQPEGRTYRGWILIARGKADELAKTIATRRETVAGLLQKAVIPDALAGNEAARKYAHDVLADLVNRFAAYPDVADLVGGRQDPPRSRSRTERAENPLTLQPRHDEFIAPSTDRFLFDPMLGRRMTNGCYSRCGTGRSADGGTATALIFWSCSALQPPPPARPADVARDRDAPVDAVLQ